MVIDGDGWRESKIPLAPFEKGEGGREMMIEIDLFRIMEFKI
jgi:hypothetical protein